MASSSNRRRRRADGDTEDLEEGEHVPSYHTTSESSDDKGDSLQSRAPEAEIRPPQFSRRMRRRLRRGGPPCCRRRGCTISDYGSSGHASFSFSGWGATGRRGRAGTKGKAIVVPRSDEQNQSKAAVVSGLNHPLQPKPLAFARPNLLSSFNIASVRPNFFVGESSRSPQSTSSENKPAAAGPSDDAFVHQQPAATQPDQQLNVELQLAPPGPPEQAGSAAPRRKYRSEICGRSYRKHQELGGHKTGHLIQRKKFEAAPAAAGFSLDSNANPAAERQSAREHKCRKCDQVFSSGPALGDHMRKHYEGVPIVVVRKSKKQCVEQPPQPGGPSTSLASPAAASPPTGSRPRLSGVDICVPVEAPAVQEGTDHIGPREGAPEVQEGASPPAGRTLRLFGVDIWVPVEAPAVPEGSYIRPGEGAPDVQEGSDIRPQVEAPAVQERTAMTEDSASIGGQLRQG